MYILTTNSHVSANILKPKRPFEYQSYYKSIDEKVIAGVCAGIAHKWSVNPTGVRFAFGILGLLWATGILLYIILWISLPGLPTKNLKFATP